MRTVCSADCVLVLVSPPGEGLVNIGASTRREGRMVVNNNNNINQLYLVIIMPDFHLVCFFDFPILLYEALRHT